MIKNVLAQLNPQQQEVVHTVDGPVLVVAGAGTGKTRTLIARLAFLASDAGIAPHKLLAITFTAKAAEEMRQRAHALCDDRVDLSPMWIGTIHSLGYELLRNEGCLIGLPADVGIISHADRAGIMRELAREFSDDSAAGSAKKIELAVSNEKNALLKEDQLSPLCRAYQEALRQTGMLDFDDLIIKPLELFEQFPEVAKRMHKRFSHISVDEYQDVNPAQYAFIRAVCAPPHNLCAVGDADQAIYAFRGARVENFLNFSSDFPRARIVYLEQNYRSTETIIEAAQCVVRRNRQRLEKKLVATRPPGPAIDIIDVPGDREEADYVAAEIERLLGGTRFENMGQQEDYVGGFGDIAVLYRMHQQGRMLKKELARRGLPVESAADCSLYDEPEIQPVMDVLEVLVAPENDFAVYGLLTASPLSPGSRTADKLKARAENLGMPLLRVLESGLLPEGVQESARQKIAGITALIAWLLSEAATKPIDRIIRSAWEALYGAADEPDDTMLELATASMAYADKPACEGIPLFLEKIAFLKEGEQLSTGGDAVRLMSAHAAKGLEFPVVFMVGLEEGLFPYLPEKDGGSEAAREEERRLFYVGMTRAQEKLCLVSARSRFLFGERNNMQQSTFLDDIPQEYVRRHSKKSPPKKKKEKQKQMKLFDL